MTLQVQTQPRLEQATLKTRKSITQLSATEVTRYRKAVDQMLKRNDNWGYQFFAGWHGVPLAICEHHNPLFLPWHRGYLYHFELGLQQIDPDVTVPWWNWMDEPDIPRAFKNKKVGGVANVLASAPIRPLGIPRQPGWPRKTHREPGAPVPPGFAAPLPPPLGQTNIPGTTGGAFAWMMAAPSYSEFMQRCWRVHDNIHVWLGGEISDPNWAAFDPLFWAHHAMVDRLWRIWQHNHPGAVPDQATRNHQMTFAKAPSFRVSEVLDVKQLGYDYAAQTSTVGGPG